MPRPQMIRADTMDLQDQDAPSAQDHTRQPTHPQPLGTGRAAPHQTQSLRNAELEAQDEQMNGSLMSDEGLSSEFHHEGIDIVFDDHENIIADSTMDGRNGLYGHNMGSVSGEEGEHPDSEGEEMLDDEMMDKISSSPSIDDEDIDFEFVYALHTFVATVEGQANATKGDTMVLLDDSNSYWWLVRVVKDGSIGYLPAEHIETPTERLARLNKHRNIDLSATMLGDNPEKSKNPLKKAMRRRNAKTVTFASPTYFEASDIDYSTEEENGGGEYGDEEDDISQADGQHTPDDSQNENIVVEPLRPKANKEKKIAEPENGADYQQSDRYSPEKPRASDESQERLENTVSRSRNGTVRNTDSFYKDDSVETKKISLTPNLLREDSTGSMSNETREGRGSFDTIDKSLSSDKSKRKEKKPGMLSGLFKRKDKKGRSSEDDLGDDLEKTSEELSRGSPTPKLSFDSAQDSREPKTQAPQRQSSKLQKQPRGDMSINTKSQPKRSPQESAWSGSETSSPSKEGSSPSIRQVVSNESGDLPVALRVRSPEATRPTAQFSPSESSKFGFGATSPIKTAIDKPSFEETLSPTSDTITEDPAVTISPTAQLNPRKGPPEPLQQTDPRDFKETLSDSPVNISPIAAFTPGKPAGLTLDTSLTDDRAISPLSPTISSPELIEAPDAKADDTTPVSTASSTVTATWSDASLRSYLDDEHDIRDLLIIVHDKSNVQPAGPDHPITGSLFKDESKRLKELSSTLDELLSTWIARKVDTRV